MKSAYFWCFLWNDREEGRQVSELWSEKYNYSCGTKISRALKNSKGIEANSFEVPFDGMGHKYLYIRGCSPQSWGRTHICCMIKENESDVTNIDFELQVKIGDKCLCLIMFSISKNWSYICNQMSDLDGVWIRM